MPPEWGRNHQDPSPPCTEAAPSKERPKLCHDLCLARGKAPAHLDHPRVAKRPAESTDCCRRKVYPAVAAADAAVGNEELCRPTRARIDDFDALVVAVTSLVLLRVEGDAHGVIRDPVVARTHANIAVILRGILNEN